MKVDNQTILMGKKKANKTDSLFHHHHQSHWPRPTSGNWNELCHWTRPQDTTLFTLFMGHRDDSSGGLRWYSILIIALGCQVLQMTEARHHHHHCRQHWKTWTSNKVPKRFWSNPVRPGPVQCLPTYEWTFCVCILIAGEYHWMHPFVFFIVHCPWSSITQLLRG